MIHLILAAHLAASAPQSTTVQPWPAQASTLSGIAQQRGFTLGTLESDNPQIGNPDVLTVGEQVWLTPGHGTAPQHQSASDEPDGDSDDPTPAVQQQTQAPAPQQPVQQPQQSAGSSQVQSGGSLGAPGSYQQCVIQHESGGNPQAVNASSGAGGLYQFLPSTWHDLGYSGSPQNASVQQQTQAFNQLHAQAGSAPWQTDGCTG